MAIKNKNLMMSLTESLNENKKQEIANFKKLNANALKINNHQVFIQSDAPVGAKAGDVWLKV